MIIDVVPEIKTSDGTGVFSYKIPEEFIDQIKTGSIVTIPFGNRKIRGIVKAKSLKFKAVSYRLKSISSINSEFVISEDYIR